VNYKVHIFIRTGSSATKWHFFRQDTQSYDSITDKDISTNLAQNNLISYNVKLEILLEISKSCEEKEQYVVIQTFS